MSETKSPKIRLYKYAAEINLSSENLIEFLKTKDYVVKSHQSVLTEEMISEINAHFKKDIEKAEQHYKKIADFNKKRADKSEKVEEVIKIEEEPVQEEEVKQIVISDVSVEVETEPIIEIPSAEEKEPETVADVVVDKKADEIVEKQSAPTQERKKFISPKGKEENKKRGLTVVGKIDLDEDKKSKPQVKRLPTQKTADGKPVVTTAADDVVKKKKRPKTKKKTTTAEVTPEETPTTKKRKRVKKFEIDEKDVKAAIKKTMLSMDDTATTNRASSRKKKRREREAEEERLEELRTLDKNIIRVNEFIAVSELANLMEVPVGDVITKCISLGLMVSINQRLDVETITLVADEFGFEVEFQKEYTSEILEDIIDTEEELQPRSAVVTIMGHVDHGKTSLLDYIRRTNVVAGESGGITQHIGAYRVDIGDGKQITFLDTPGHEAFTAMRARGAQLTDIVVLVVAADDAVMPQTVEALNHAQAAGVPIIIAINKIDKPGANPEKIKQQMADRNVLVEDWGGKYQSVQLSAKTGLNVDLLLEKIILEADILDLKANPNRFTRGAVVEAELDKGRGITATILVQKGTLRIGDSFVAGIHHGKVRAMFDERGNKVKEAPPSTPVLVLGFEGAPQAGDTFIVLESEREAREISLKRQQLKREQDQKQIHHITLDELAKQISIGGVKELALIVKGDVDGSVEALSDSLMKLSNQEVIVRVIHKGVGGISESDVLLAAASNAIIIGFHVRPNINARKLAETQKVDIRLYNIIYDAISEVKSALEGLLSPLISEEVTGTIEIRETFKVPKSGTVAGCYVLDGKITRNNKIRLIRDGIVIHEGGIGNLRRFKDDVKEVDAGYECGLNIENYNDIKVGDIIEAFKIVETKKTLA
ncbi:MAG: translation initiation factor IF-2 [Ignavibacteriaceae bacterium]|nr:translation initiation factor IF-2 [Ignavibacterium sp.]MCC6255816.1 translation initiation factor IF-2 [Ignavibacteriaceae bacterium]HRN27049.1 translation initiation factor IF-2 [Ignavibacteriaceae bacterium]HRP92513.1 translation initiation factor IF-2 [Ignavibacteriaceae bacterium]HRQ54669.1 translation initiation factor IF-2 [Ignavibacteriaceae bacterium]